MYIDNIIMFLALILQTGELYIIIRCVIMMSRCFTNNIQCKIIVINNSISI